MSNAERYITKIFQEIKTAEEAQSLLIEIIDWTKKADEKEVELFRNSGAGEMLYTLSVS